jgi:hypothetical protein
MELRTTFSITPTENKITYNDPVMFIGSCFAASVGKQLEAGRMPVMINPSGTVYNPFSICNTLDTITFERKYKISDLYNNNGTWLSFNHYTDFSSEQADEVVLRINDRNEKARDFISRSRFLFITFGTARVYRWKKSGKIVSNCHKIPSAEFTNELLSVEAIVTLWKNQLDRLKSLFPEIKVIFTVSPVRHWKDGAHGNQVSKAVLFLAIEELIGHPSNPGYFPAYELVMDDLRDYRFYDDDMLHPSRAAVDYIWNAFSDCYLDDKTKKLWHEINSITKAVSHKIQTTSKSEITKFAKNILSRIDAAEKKLPGINLVYERTYFNNLLRF